MKPGNKAHPERELKQFLLLDKRLQNKDADFWQEGTKRLLDVYRTTTVLFDEDRATKAAACGGLAGFAYAMARHFSSAVDSLIDTSVGTEESADVEATVTAGERSYNNGVKHTAAMENLCDRHLS